MKATKQEMDLRKPQMITEKLDVAALNAQRQTMAAPISELHGDMLWSVVKKLREPELIAFIADPDVTRASKISTIAKLPDVDLLIALAAADVEIFARRDALLRIDELCDSTPLPQADVERLAPCLEFKELIAYAVVLMDMSDYDWCAHCGEHTVDALCAAMYESVLLEDTFAHLSHARPDLNKSLRACSPDKFLTEDTYAPTTPTVMYLDRYPVDNVA